MEFCQVNTYSLVSDLWLRKVIQLFSLLMIIFPRSFGVYTFVSVLSNTVATSSATAVWCVQVEMCCKYMLGFKKRRSYFDFLRRDSERGWHVKSCSLLSNRNIFIFMTLMLYFITLRGQMWNTEKYIEPQQIVHLVVTTTIIIYIIFLFTNIFTS